MASIPWWSKNSLGRILFFSLAMLTVVNLFAQTQITSAQMEKRIHSIHQILNQERRSTDCWWYGWLGLYAAATIGQGAVYLSSEKKSLRQDMALGAVTSFLGVAGQIITPLHPGRYADRLTNMPGTTREELQQKLHVAESAFRTTALTEMAGRSWQTHLLFGTVNLASGLITWLGFHRTARDGLENFALNSAIAEAQIWTQPTQIWKRYQHLNPAENIHSAVGSGSKFTNIWVNTTQKRIVIEVCF